MPTSLEAVAIFLFFLPGIVGTILYQSIAEVTKPGNFDKIAIAIALSLLSSFLADLFFGVPISGAHDVPVGQITLPTVLESYAGADAVIRIVVACVLGVLAALVQNYGWFYALCRRVRLTRRTGRIDPWHQTFREYNNKWVRLSYMGGQRLVGWIRWYSESGEKQLFLAEATWYMPQERQAQVQPPGYRKVDVKGPGVFISNFNQVLGVDLLD